MGYIVDYTTREGKAPSIGEVVPWLGVLAPGLDFLLDWLSKVLECFGKLRTMAVGGYCKKIPHPKAFVGVAMNFNMNADPLLTLAFLKQIPKFELQKDVLDLVFQVGLSVVFGAIPGNPEIGGVRIGLGTGAHFRGQFTEAKDPMFSLKGRFVLGATASAIIALPSSRTYPKFGCFRNPIGVQPFRFKCFAGTGTALFAICCNWDVVTGETDCR